MALGIIKVKLLPFKAFKRVGNHGKRVLHARILLQIKCTGTFKLTFVPMNGARFSSKWRAHASTKKGNGENGRGILLTIPTKRCLASYSSSAQSVKQSAM